LLYDSKNISEVEHRIYNLWKDFYSDHVRSFKNICYIYLKCDAKVCHDRIKKRSRIEEESINIDYLENLFYKNNQ
jgi:deoxyadenosine/deoxycytidine kinase